MLFSRYLEDIRAHDSSLYLFFSPEIMISNRSNTKKFEFEFFKELKEKLASLEATLVQDSVHPVQ